LRSPKENTINFIVMFLDLNFFIHFSSRFPFGQLMNCTAVISGPRTDTPFGQNCPAGFVFDRFEGVGVRGRFLRVDN
jgi:hypothetical protein